GRAVRQRRSLLRLRGLADPCERGSEVSRRMRDDLEPHAGMPGAAELRAGPLVAPWRVDLDPQDIDATGNRVDLAGKARDPERVDDVATRDRDIDRRSDRQVQDAGGRLAALVRIAERPA